MLVVTVVIVSPFPAASPYCCSLTILKKKNDNDNSLIHMWFRVAYRGAWLDCFDLHKHLIASYFWRTAFVMKDSLQTHKSVRDCIRLFFRNVGRQWVSADVVYLLMHHWFSLCWCTWNFREGWRLYNSSVKQEQVTGWYTILGIRIRLRRALAGSHDSWRQHPSLLDAPESWLWLTDSSAHQA